jgi:hypothetical protein
MDEPEIKIIDVFMCKLRKKLTNAAAGKDYIKTVRGRGYLLCDPSANLPRTAHPPDVAVNALYDDAEWAQTIHNVIAIEKQRFSIPSSVD